MSARFSQHRAGARLAQSVELPSLSMTFQKCKRIIFKMPVIFCRTACPCSIGLQLLRRVARFPSHESLGRRAIPGTKRLATRSERHVEQVRLPCVRWCTRTPARAVKRSGPAGDLRRSRWRSAAARTLWRRAQHRVCGASLQRIGWEEDVEQEVGSDGDAEGVGLWRGGKTDKGGTDKGVNR